jgi:fructosamine-3-kinase
VRFRKSGVDIPSGYFAWEAAGLCWLAHAVPFGGVRVAEVLEVNDDHLDLVHLDSVVPTADAAYAFGEQLARTHASGADAFGSGPPGCSEGFFGPTADPLPLQLGAWDTWGAFYADARIAPMTALLRDRGDLDASDTAVLERLSNRLGQGLFDTDDAPSRIHGDLWAGNLMWTPEGVTLIDPAAHGGHPETDLAALALFGAPFLERIRDGYANARPLASGWADRVELHQLYCLLVHATLFGGGYAAASLAVARRYA